MPSNSKSRQSPLVAEQASTCDPRDASVSIHIADEPSQRCKQPIKDFEWGVGHWLPAFALLLPDTRMKGDLIRKTLPASTLPRWLDPYHVDVADPTGLPLCWYGVPFVRKLIYPYTERIGLASYYTKQVLRAKPGDLDTFQTWANLDVWFQKESGLKLDLNLVWGHPTPILTFFSNHEAASVTKEQLDLISDLLDDMDYGDEYQLMWYLDRNLDVRPLLSLLITAHPF